MPEKRLVPYGEKKRDFSENSLQNFVLVKKGDLFFERNPTSTAYHSKVYCEGVCNMYVNTHTHTHTHEHTCH